MSSFQVPLGEVGAGRRKRSSLSSLGDSLSWGGARAGASLFHAQLGGLMQGGFTRLWGCLELHLLEAPLRLDDQTSKFLLLGHVVVEDALQ